MGETLKERLDRLSEAATPGKCHQDLATIVFPDANPSDHEIDNVAFTIELWNAYRTGDMIPRDEITPQMAAEVLLGDDVSLARMAKAMHDGPLGADDHDFSITTKSGQWCVDCIRAALTASAPITPPPPSQGDSYMADQISVTSEMQDRFAVWFRENYPGPNTVIHNPDFHAPKIFRAALLSVHRIAGKPEPAPIDRMKVHQAFVYLRDARPAHYEAAIQKAEAILEEALGGKSDG